MQWAAAGTSVTLYLTEIDPIHLDTGSVLCPQTHPVELASAFTARIIVFDIQVPILAGTSVSERLWWQFWPGCLTQVCVGRAFPSFSRCPSGDIKAECYIGAHDRRSCQAKPTVRPSLFLRARGANARVLHTRVLTKGTSAEVQITMRQAAFAGAGTRNIAIPLEPFATNKEMGRILIRRGGETIAAGECAFARCTCLS